MSPSFVGTEPTLFTHTAASIMRRSSTCAGRGTRSSGALDASQKAAADPGPIPRDVRTGPGKDGFVPPTIGLVASEMAADQKTLLLAAIDRWVSIQPSGDAARRMAELKADFDRIYFAWTGISDANARAYMRIQGPTLIIELASRGSSLGHYHTIYRDPTLEYGGSAR